MPSHNFRPGGWAAVVVALVVAVIARAAMVAVVAAVRRRRGDARKGGSVLVACCASCIGVVRIAVVPVAAARPFGGAQFALITSCTIAQRASHHEADSSMGA